jgi:hypothetical protein
MKIKGSSSIDAISYNKKTSELTVQMKDNSVVVYLGVPEHVYHDFIDAPSAGIYYNTTVRGQYKFRYA